ncbi:diguanylate cyclase [Hylemonella gracilis str. Niagara R]|uniref:Diguanylate cyclase n=1 Tax=Hylemonella gracilis str. Niagara R TaxID=1458275 RepID=A0A016XDD7_9BURK|nr:EAL domain-containing protein [Hylemonella gracilis]EYC49851.1 diguanylate cyclase [Hylemonella gracilis str. Niagara R]
MTRSRGALDIVLVYVVFASLWILLSDRLTGWLLRDPDMLLLASTLKGWLFVAVSATLLHFLLRRRIRPLPIHAGLADAAAARHALLRSMAVFTVLALVVVLVVASTIWQAMREEREQAHTQLRAIVQSKARELSAWQQERLGDAARIANTLYLRTRWATWRERGDAQSQRALQRFLEQAGQPQGFVHADIVDAQGRRWLDGSPSRDAPADAALAQAARLAIEQSRPQWVGLWRDAQGAWRLALVAALGSGGSNGAGNDIAREQDRAALVLHADADAYLRMALSDWPMLRSGAEAVLLRREGAQFIFAGELVPERAAQLRGVLARLSWPQPDGALVDGFEHHGVPALAVIQRIGETEWWLLVKQSPEEMLHGAAASGAWMALTAVLGLLALGVALYLRHERHRRLHSLRDIEELQRAKQALLESEALYRLLADNSSDVVWLYDLEADHYLYASPAVRLFGYDPAQATSMSFRDVLPPEVEQATRERLYERIAALQEGDEDQRTALGQTPVLCGDGKLMPTEVVTTLLTDEKTGRVTRVLGVTRDITQRKRDQDQLIRLSQAIEQSPASVVITNLEGNIEYVNPAFEAMSGYAQAEVLGTNPRLLNSGRTPSEVYDTMWLTIKAGQAWHGELINRAKDGRDYVVSMTIAPVRNAQDEVAHYLAVQLDVTQQRNAEEKARQLAWFHPLTGLPNRHRLLLDLKETLDARGPGRGSDSSNGAASEQCALLLLDLDRFQTVNDALGPAVGDQLLRQLSWRFAAALPPEAQLAHLNADEFAVLLQPARGPEQAGAAGEPAVREAVSAQALRLAQSLHDTLTMPVQLGRGESLAVSCCIGITLLPHRGESQEAAADVSSLPEDTPEDVLRRADTALHRAKNGRGREGSAGHTAFFDASMEQVVSRRFLIERDLRRGLAAGELRVYLQPQVDADGQMVSAEALVRWQHPEQGLVPPGAFIPVAEESELITDVGRWVLQGVCAHLGALRTRGLRLPIAVNVSTRQFHQPSFVHEVQEALRVHAAAPGDLIIEITESILMEQVENVTSKMSQLAGLGVKFSLDDFGTGYSSLAYLKRLPIDEIKIDRSFVQDAPTDPNDAALVDAILSVARHLRLKVVAEGVETRAQADFLHARGQIVQQGYLHGRPAPAEDVLAAWEQAQA